MLTFNNSCRIDFTENGSIRNLCINGEKVDFRSDEYSGPSIFTVVNGKEEKINFKAIQNNTFVSVQDKIKMVLSYCPQENGFSVEFSIENQSDKDISFDRVFMRIGINTYMDKYPEWNDLYFPTLLRCEKTHFYGYFSSPSGKIFAITSNDRVVSWSNDYNRTRYGVEEHVGHRIYTSCIDFINSAPQPEHHPIVSPELKSGEKRNYKILFSSLNNINEFDKFVSKTTCAPEIITDKFTYEKGDFPRISATGNLDMISPLGEEENICELSNKIGLHKLLSEKSGKISQKNIYIRDNWSRYLEIAAKTAIKAPQKASTHMESWLGYFSLFYMLKYFPDKCDKPAIIKDFDTKLSLMFDVENGVPLECSDTERIQNSAMMVSLLSLCFEVTCEERYIVLAEKLVRFLMSRQASDGSYRSNGVHYTCVAYIAKSIMEFYLVIKDKKGFEKITQLCYDSVSAAIENLSLLGDNIQTEGEITFEDGMITCEILQLAMYVMMFPPQRGSEYLRVAEELLAKHRCLEQIKNPDCRQRGCTIRFWESMYDVIINRNFISSPHGWTAWKIYALYYLYRITAKEEYLTDMMDTLGACMQCVDLEKETLNWGFISDPCVETEVFTKNKGGTLEKRLIGEQYVSMISDWWTADGFVKGFAMPLIGCTEGIYKGAACDNDIHECFKCLAEVALTKVYIHESKMQVRKYNCILNGKEIIPAEDIVDEILIYVSESAEYTVIKKRSQHKLSCKAGLNVFKI